MDDFDTTQASRGGQGAFGVVYKTKAKKTGDMVALKVIDLTRGTTGAVLPTHVVNVEICSVLREMMTNLYCRHPAVTRFVGWNFYAAAAKSTVIIVTEWMEKGCLNVRTKFSPTEKSIIAYGGARGLALLHDRKVIHRDVKPGNILLDKNNYPRIADLGLAKMIEDDPSQTSAVGSPLFMAPELIGAEDETMSDAFSFPVDVYAYAISLQQLYAGKDWVPPNVRTAALLGRRIVNDNLRPPRPPGLSDDLWKLLTKMWHKEPAQRPTFAEVVTALEQPRYWVPGTIAEKFSEYLEYVQREEGRGVAVIEDWQNMLANSSSAKALAAELAKETYGASLAARMAHAIGIISGEGGQVNEEVVRAVQVCLDEKGYLDPAVINAQAHAINDPDAAPEIDEPDELPPLEIPEQPAYHFDWVKDGQSIPLTVYMDEAAVVQDLFKVLADMIKGPFDLHLGSRELEPYSRKKFTDLKLGEYIVTITVRN
jgi:hypothetical protein